MPNKKPTVTDLISASDRQRGKIKTDMREVYAAKQAGKPIPPAERLAAYFQTTYHTTVSPSTIRTWLRTGVPS